MESLKELYKEGPGPSGSHTIGPMRASLKYLQLSPDAAAYGVELWGSLAATGRGHFTDAIIEKTFAGVGKSITVTFKPDYSHSFHPNGMRFHSTDDRNREVFFKVFFSVGGGSILEEGQPREPVNERVYPFKNFTEITHWCKNNALKGSLWQVITTFEPDAPLHLSRMWDIMKSRVEDGLKKTGTLPGILQYPRRAKDFFTEAKNREAAVGEIGELFAYALAVAEENAAGETIVTAPTCGAAGVVPGLFYYLQKKYGYSDEKMVEALGCAGLVGLIIKKNASISGAEAGCQAEIGSACSMAAAGAAYLFGASLEQFEYAAEIAMEHSLGLTCDPVAGLVQVPCIERNAMGACRALDSARFAMFTSGGHMVNLDTAVAVMMETGLNMKCEYKETSRGGLAGQYYMEGS